MNMEKTKKNKKQPLRIWLVEITLTSGKGLQVYVPAKDEFAALEKADDYATMAENEQLYNYYKGKTMLP